MKLSRITKSLEDKRKKFQNFSTHKRASESKSGKMSLKCISRRTRLSVERFYIFLKKYLPSLKRRYNASNEEP